MPRWLPRAFVLALALVACYQFAHWVFARLVGLLVNVLISFFRALAIEPAVDWMAMRRTLCSMPPPAHQAEVLRAWDIAVAKTGGYL
jgi:hypothetical protein